MQCRAWPRLSALSPGCVLSAWGPGTFGSQLSAALLDPMLLRPRSGPTPDFAVNQPIVHSGSMSKILWLCVSAPWPRGPSQLVLRYQFTAQFTGSRGAVPCPGVDPEGGSGLSGPRPPPPGAGSCRVLELESRGEQAESWPPGPLPTGFPPPGSGCLCFCVEIVLGASPSC